MIDDDDSSMATRLDAEALLLSLQDRKGERSSSSSRRPPLHYRDTMAYNLYQVQMAKAWTEVGQPGRFHPCSRGSVIVDVKWKA